MYNFRVVPDSWDEEIIKEISSLGHEIGYHYEITMHGSPKSKHDSKDLWKNNRYKDLGLIGEPYFDIDFSKVLYLTDTGRRWDGSKVSIRDRVNPAMNNKLKEKGYPMHSTDDIIKAARDNALPDAMMFTIHPQRWHSSKILWLNELILQNVKNVVKRVLLGLVR